MVGTHTPSQGCFGLSCNSGPTVRHQLPSFRKLLLLHFGFLFCFCFVFAQVCDVYGCVKCLHVCT